MPDDAAPSEKSIQSLIDDLVAALHVRAWVDEPEDRSEVRREIIRRVRAGESLAPILALLDHHDWAVRADAAEILGWVRGLAAVDPLLARLWRDRSGVVRDNIKLALARIGSPEALAASQEYSHTVRSYPEVLGHVVDLSERHMFDPARQGLTSGMCIRDKVERGQGKLLAFDLADLLAMIGERARASKWCCEGVECSGEYADELYGIDDKGLIVSGRTLAYIALMIVQTIDGTFVALNERDEVWLMIRAVDSSFFEVWSHESDILSLVRRHFQEVTELPIV